MGALFIHHALRAAEMLEQEVEIILRGLEGQLVQQLLGGRGLLGGERGGEDRGSTEFFCFDICIHNRQCNSSLQS